MKSNIVTIFRRAVVTASLAAVVCAAPQNASAGVFSVFESLGGTIYTVFSNPIYDQETLTQLFAGSNTAIGTSFYDSSAQTLNAFAWTPGTLFTASGQSGFVTSTSITDFDVSGDGTLTFGNGTVITSGGLGAFTGVATTLSPDPAGYIGPFNVYGFNLPPGGHPTTTVLAYGPGPADGITVAKGQSIVFTFIAPPGVGRAVGEGDFSLNGGQTVQSSVSTIAFPPPAPPIPEPSSFFLLGGGLAALAARRRTRSRRALISRAAVRSAQSA